MNDCSADPNSSSEEPTCRDIRAKINHDIVSRELENHDDCRSYNGYAERDGVAENLPQTFALNNWEHLFDDGKMEDAQLENNGLVITSGEGDEEPTRGDDHVQTNYDVNGHAVVNHEIRQCCRGEITQTKGDTSSRSNLQPKPRVEYPWTAPRVLARYLALRMQRESPTVWSIDDYDGTESWEEEGAEPSIKYEDDTNMNTNQYHKLMHEL